MAAALATVAATTVSKPRRGTRVRRTAEQIRATANRIHAFVRATPSTNAEAIRKGLSIAKNEWLAPLSSLMEAKRLTPKGQQCATTYAAVDASADAAPGRPEGPRAVLRVPHRCTTGTNAREALSVSWTALGARLPPLHTGAWRTLRVPHTLNTADYDHPLIFMIFESRVAGPGQLSGGLDPHEPGE